MDQAVEKHGSVSGTVMVKEIGPSSIPLSPAIHQS
jgi:hypothetical protein